MFFHVFEMVHHLFFTGSYSNQVFPEPLSLEEETVTIEKMLKGDKEARNKNYRRECRSRECRFREYF